jgi:transposase
MIQLTPHMRILVAVDPVDFRKRIDGLARVCKEELQDDPFGGTVFLFRNRKRTMVRVLCYDGQGFWLAEKRLSRGRFRYWVSGAGETTAPLEAHQVQLLLSAGDPGAGSTALPPWRRLPDVG